MKVIRKISSDEDIQKKISEMHAHSELWSIKWQAARESDQYSYRQMQYYLQLEKQYLAQARKKSENDVQKKLSNLCSDIETKTQYYLNSRICFFMHPSRKKSIDRLRHFSLDIQNKSWSFETKLIALEGYLLKELNDTETSHNNNFISKKFTVSRLATLYMSIFDENGIDPKSNILKKKANEYFSDEETGCLKFL